MNRDELVIANLDLPQRAAGNAGFVGIEIEDLVSVGNIALVEASRRWDPGRGVPFRPYAYRRIRGAIIDEARDRSFVPRKSYARGERATIASLDAPLFGGAESAPEQFAIGHTIQAREASVEELVEQRDRIQAALTSGSARDREIMLRRANGQSDEQIGKALGITRGRVCQIAKKAHARRAAQWKPPAPQQAGPLPSPANVSLLSPAEILTLHGAAHGESSLATAKRLQKSVETIKAQRRAIIHKLGARNICHAVLLASPHLLALPALP